MKKVNNMDVTMKKVYEFNITVLGSGDDVDEAFQDALYSIANDASNAVQGEVVYALLKGVVDEDKEDDELN